MGDKEVLEKGAHWVSRVSRAKKNKSESAQGDRMSVESKESNMVSKKSNGDGCTK